MKKIRPIVLKKARVLSNEEMKHLYGGSGLTPGDLINRTCKTGPCRVYFFGASSTYVKTGTCQGSFANGSVSCYCEIGGSAISSTNLSHCFRGN